MFSIPFLSLTLPFRLLSTLNNEPFPSTSEMFNSFANNGQELNFLQLPPRALQYEETENHPHPEQFLSTIPIAGPSSEWYSLPGASSAPSSSVSFQTSGIRSFPQSASQTPHVSPLGIHGVPTTSSAESVYHASPNAPSGNTRFDPAFLANEGPSSAPLRQRPRPSGESGWNNASIDAFSHAKLRRISGNNHQNSPDVPYSANAYNINVVNPNPSNNLVPGAPVAVSYANGNTTPYPNVHVPRPSVLPNPAYNMGPNQAGPNVMAMNNTTWYNQNENPYRPASNQFSAPPTGVGPPAIHPSRTQFGPNVYPGNGNYYNTATTSLIPNFAPPNLPNAPLGWTPDFPGPESFYNTSAVSAGSEPNVASRFSEIPINKEVNSTYEDENDETYSCITDCDQHPGSAFNASVTEHAASTNAIASSSSGTQDVDPLAITQEIDLSLSSYEVPKKRTRNSERKPAIDPRLWYLQDGFYYCQYIGPDRPEGCWHPNQIFKTNSIRNLERHVRKHARVEAGMSSLPQNQRVAMNALAEYGKLRTMAKCDLEDKDLPHCAFYRKHDRRWAAMTMERAENLERKHRKRYHDLDWQEKTKKPRMPRSKSQKKRGKTMT